jgi:aminoglycoside phosphotransferase (APT) family kinase protein
VVDWEMSTLGDPLADLGMTLTYWQDPGDGEAADLPIVPRVTAAPGFFTAKEFAAHYAKASGADLGDLDFYVAFGHYKIAVIAEGIYTRFKLGKTVGEGFEQAGESTPLLIERAHRLLDG